MAPLAQMRCSCSLAPQWIDKKVRNKQHNLKDLAIKNGTDRHRSSCCSGHAADVHPLDKALLVISKITHIFKFPLSQRLTIFLNYQKRSQKINKTWNSREGSQNLKQVKFSGICFIWIFFYSKCEQNDFLLINTLFLLLFHLKILIIFFNPFLGFTINLSLHTNVNYIKYR